MLKTIWREERKSPDLRLALPAVGSLLEQMFQCKYRAPNCRQPLPNSVCWFQIADLSMKKCTILLMSWNAEYVTELRMG